MLWSDIEPYVLPYVIGCPAPVITHHARLAAIEFCRRTGCYQRTLDPLVTSGFVSMEMEAEGNLQINKIHAVTVDGRHWPLVSVKHGLDLSRNDLSREDSTPEFCFTQDNINLSVYPLQKRGLKVVIEATVVPTLTAPSLDDFVAQTYIQDIAMGAIASIQRLPGMPFTEMNLSAAMFAQFNARIATVAAKVSRGYMAGRVRSHTTYL